MVGQVYVTPPMLEAGVKLLADEWGVVSRHAAGPMVEDIFRAMILADYKIDSNLVTARLYGAEVEKASR